MVPRYSYVFSPFRLCLVRFVSGTAMLNDYVTAKMPIDAGSVKVSLPFRGTTATEGSGDTLLALVVS